MNKKPQFNIVKRLEFKGIVVNEKIKYDVLSTTTESYMRPYCKEITIDLFVDDKNRAGEIEMEVSLDDTNLEVGQEVIVTIG